MRDERLIMGRWSGALWLLAGAVGAAGQAMPGVPHDHAWLAWTLIAISVVYGAACLTGVIPWERVSYGGHLAAIIAWQPLLALALWASGGVDSYVQPVFILALLYAAYFMPGWMAWVGVGALVVTNATPLLYTSPGEHQAAARILAFAVACEGVTLTLQHLKRRLVTAEQAAATAPPPPDPLTGLHRRDALDAALERAVAQAGDPRVGRRAGDGGVRFSLLLVEIEDLATVTDTFGPLAADRVIVDVAESVRGVLRPSDVVARTRPAELAVLASGAGEPGSLRLAQAIREAASDVRPGPSAPPVALTVSWALFPDESRDPAGLFAAADRGLHARRRLPSSRA
ncbi:GGDEF domain-containing protein [Capillimicrobium parvum]|uniref:GGDEF domain-containing protein n=1 Tax=Capillimicrobium parvum TaxID=2884022 RepID=UPI00216B2CA5|nr:GGDEF domain-containing protein [Capillimicrobium parvum]